MEWRGDLEPDDLLFPSPEIEGQPISYSTVYGVFKRALKFLSLPSVSLHSVRHSYTSTMLAAGVPVTTVARNLGHSSPNITWGIYAHEVRNGARENLERAEKLFGAAEPEEAEDD